MVNKFIDQYKLYPFEFFFKGYESENSIILDLFDLLASVYFTDILTTRLKEKSMHITVQVPVVNIGMFERNISSFNKILNFMTPEKEKWLIELSEVKEKQLPKRLFYKNSPIGKYNNVSLFSGGLDSYCGAYYNYKQNDPTYYVSYRTNNIENMQAQTLKNFLQKKSKVNEFEFFKLKRIKKIEHSQRTRSLLFIGLGLAICDFNGISKLNLYENGILSLNPELNFSRDTTKTTHPYVLNSINKILTDLDLKITIDNPFFFKTKSEMIGMLDEDFTKKITDTMTCGISRQNPKFDNSNNKHCGACIACLLRRISVSKNNLEDYDAKYDYSFNIEHPLHTEFTSSLFYFSEYSKYIDNKTIYSSICLNQDLINNNNYKENLYKLMNNFSMDVKYFKSKFNLK